MLIILIASEEVQQTANRFDRYTSKSAILLCIPIDDEQA